MLRTDEFKKDCVGMLQNLLSKDKWQVRFAQTTYATSYSVPAKRLRGQVELLGQLVCTGPHYQGVARLLQHQPGQLYGVPHVADSGHTTAVQAPAVHQHRVHLHLAL